MRNRNNCSMFITPVSEEELHKQLITLNKHKATGPDEVSPGILRLCVKEIIIPLTHIINLSFSQGIVPQVLKLAKVFPIHKKNETFLPGNYRPISLLSSIDKVVEKLMYSRISKFLAINKILYDYQFGFRENHSTSMTLIDITDNIRDQLDKGNFTLGMFFDLKKAFDTVDHNILISKLEHYGIRGVAGKWISSYLSNRQQFTHVNGENSQKRQINFGVPQGSILGPLLFLLYINDIGQCTQEGNVRLFADDTAIFVSHSNPKVLKEKAEVILNNLQNWFIFNRLTLNIEKSNFSVYCSPNKAIPAYLNNLKIGTKKLERVHSVKYLGVTIDDKLTWNDHCNCLIQDLVKLSNSFKIIKNFISDKNKYKLYNAYVLPKLRYGLEVYGNTSKGNMQKVQVMQNRILKVLFNKDFLMPTKELHKELTLLLVNDMHKHLIVQFVYKAKHKHLPSIFDNYYQENQSLHNYSTRYANQLHPPYSRTVTGSKSIKISGVKAWNELPNYLTSIDSFSLFKKKTKQHYLESY